MVEEVRGEENGRSGAGETDDYYKALVQTDYYNQHMTKSLRPSSSIAAYWKQSNNGGSKDLGRRLPYY